MNAASKKILIADDDASIRLVLSQAFTRLGYQVRATGNAATLLKWVTEGEGDLVVTDVVMPRLGGRELAERIAGLRPSARVLYVSGYTADAAFRAEVLERTTAFLQKPFGPDDLARKVREVLDA
jgi:two-component system nitrogen regulation response regulator GlnG